MRNKIIRVDGTEVEILHKISFENIAKLIGADMLDTVDLRDGRVMVVNDLGYELGLLINPKATKLYHAVCKPGTTHQIVGDVAVVYDDDFN